MGEKRKPLIEMTKLELQELKEKRIADLGQVMFRLTDLQVRLIPALTREREAILQDLRGITEACEFDPNEVRKYWEGR